MRTLIFISSALAPTLENLIQPSAFIHVSPHLSSLRHTWSRQQGHTEWLTQIHRPDTGKALPCTALMSNDWFKSETAFYVPNIYNNNNFPPVSSYNLTTRSGKPTTTRAKEPVSASTRLGETIFWSRAALRFSLGSCSHDTIWGTDTSAGMGGSEGQRAEQRRKREKEMLKTEIQPECLLYQWAHCWELIYFFFRLQ